MKHSSWQGRSQFARHHLMSDDLWTEECGPCTSPDPYRQSCSWTERLLTSSLRWGHTVWRALAHCGPLCLAQWWSYSFLLHPKLHLWGLIRCQCTEARFGFPAGKSVKTSSGFQCNYFHVYHFWLLFHI